MIQQVFWWLMWALLTVQLFVHRRDRWKLRAAREEYNRELESLQEASDMMEKARDGVAQWHLAIGRMFDQFAERYPDDALLGEMRDAWRKEVLNGGAH